jgi:acetyl-CoA acetyltransferase
MKLDQGKNNACIVGVGRSTISRDSGKTAVDLVVDACVNAIRHAGLTGDNIDGIATNQMSGVNGYQIADALRFPTVNWFGQMELPQVTAAWSLMEAAMAIEYGACDYAVVVMGLMKPKGSGSSGSRRDPFAGSSGPPKVGGDAQWMAPYGGSGFVFNHFMSRYMHVYNAPRETFGHIAVTARKHAMLNERAIARAPLTMEDYLNARWISDPFCLYDCDYPVDGYAAVVVTRADRARHLPNKAVQLVAGAQNTGPRTDMLQWDDHSNMGSKYAAKKLWTLIPGTTLKDIDVVMCYDGFTILTVNWIESFGFCGFGEAKDFLKGDMMQLGGSGIPMNTHGGMLSEGRVHGMGYIAEAADQLMGNCGERQVQNATRALVGQGGSVQNAALFLQTLD